MKFLAYSFSILILLFLSCAEHKTIQIAGSETISPIVQKAVEQFEKIHPEISITVTAGGTGNGIRQIGESQIQIAMGSRDVTWQEKKQYPNANFQLHAFAKDAVVPAASAAILNNGVRALSLRQIGDIYAGKITNWKTLGGPDRDIEAIDTDQSSGTRHIFMARILKDRNAQAQGVDRVVPSDKERLAAITNSNAAIGMLPRTWLNRTVPGLGIQVAGGVIIPTDENIQKNRYPTSRELFLITPGAPTGDVKLFIDFLLSTEGQKIVKDAGFVPI